MPKGSRVDDALMINDENDRILEMWFHARASEKFCKQRDPSDIIFVANVAGQEDRKTLSSSLDHAESVPESLEVCFVRQKITLSLPVLEQFANNIHTVAMYARPPQERTEEGTTINQKSAKPTGKKERSKKVEDAFALEGAEQLFFANFDLVDLLRMPSVRVSVPVQADSELQDCVVEISCGTPLLTPVKLKKYRPLNIEVHAIYNLPRSNHLNEPVFISLKLGDIHFHSPEIYLAPDGKIMFRRVIFLGTRTPLAVYQDMFFKKLEVSVFIGTSICVGTGTVSLRSAVTDQQTQFSEMVTLLPCRTTPYLGDSCLTKDTIVSLRLDLFTPLPPLKHVLSDGRPANGCFLTRGIIRMPYKAKWIAGAMEAFITTLLQLKKARQGSDVYQLILPPIESDIVTTKEKKKERSKTSKSQPVVPLRPPSPPSAFDSPFGVVTPPGISGFEVMDDNVRIICVEGPAVEVHKILECVSAAAGDDPQLALLMNVELFVPKRNYLVFPPLVTVPQIANESSAVPVAVEAADVDPKKNFTYNNSVTPPNQGSRLAGYESAGAIPTDTMTSLTSMREKDNMEDTFDNAEAEAGGTGGRIHRIRIRETIDSLVSQQKYLLKRMLSESCVNCYTKLSSLCQCVSLRDALERDLFPTPEELIALERSFGVTLELSDVFGKEEFVNVVVTKELEDFSYHEVEEDSSSGIDVTSLRWSDIGKTVIFQATRNMSKRKRIPDFLQERYRHICWMRMLDTRKDVLCAFPAGSQPGGTIRYLVEAQVVRCDNFLLLYALGCNSLAKSCTDSHNPRYEAHLTALRRQKTQMLLLRNRKGKDMPTTSTNLQQVASRKHEESSDDDDDYDNCNNDNNKKASADSPPCEVITASTSKTVVREKNMVAHNRKKIASLTKKIPRITDADYELCWELYHRRSPVLPPKPQKGPPMHF
ncbi:uncharacterized protein TM35_000071510 [Trypanosoma theileri]|uniref:Uncharacterized protein n=1 Tax=Trypanosoma theileri TaxID=67003 RepID=A0A1X0P1C6_9TRYP|nr:uncharacterized protein TM35_000071510 [Trypanosoma theileri]ORC90727.1 hypothetical protein TM35_000071510 [Trypanosoma theileri]